MNDEKAQNGNSDVNDAARGFAASFDGRGTSAPKHSQGPLFDNGSEPTNSGSNSDNGGPTREEIETIENRDEISLSKIFNPKSCHPYLTDALIEEYCTVIKIYMFPELAAASIGISYSSLKDWVRQGRKVHEWLWYNINLLGHSETGKSQLQEIVDALTPEDWTVYKLYKDSRLALAQSEIENLEFVNKARSKDWRAAKWLLEVQNRSRYAETKETLNVNVSATASDGSAKIEVINYENYVNDPDSEIIEVQAIEENETT